MKCRDCEKKLQKENAILREECKHSPMPNTVVHLDKVTCSKCGIELIATWNAK